MLTKSRLFIFLAVTAFSAGSLQAQEPPPGCPQDLEALSNWWVTTPDIGHVVEIRAWLTFTNITDGDVEFEPDANEKLQIWSIPGVMDPSPVVFSSWPTGITPPGENYSYDVTMGIADLPLSQTGLAFRPQSLNLGTMGPARAGLVSAEFSCVEGRRYSEQSAIPAMSSWSRFALLLMVVGVASLVMRRRFS